jgi:phosphatidylglycerophosphate synthase
MAVHKEVLRNFTFANQLTFLRLVAVPFFIICVLTNQPGSPCCSSSGRR